MFHSPSTTSSVTYYLSYQLEGTGTTSAVGIIGTSSTNSNNIILEEYLSSGLSGTFSINTYGTGSVVLFNNNSLYYDNTLQINNDTDSVGGNIVTLTNNYISATGGFNFLANTTSLLSFSNNNFKIPILAGSGSRQVSADSLGNLTIPPSDKRLKKNISPLPSVLSKVVSLVPVTYKWDPETDIKNSSICDDYIQYGFIAQDVESQFPDLVYELKLPHSDVIYKGYNENRFIPILLKAIQELDQKQKQIDDLTDRVKALEEKLN